MISARGYAPATFFDSDLAIREGEATRVAQMGWSELRIDLPDGRSRVEGVEIMDVRMQGRSDPSG